MNPSVPLDSLSPYSFGTMSLGRDVRSLADDVQVARAAMEAGVWFHTSREYGQGDTFMVLRHAFVEAPQLRPSCILKIRGDNTMVLRFDVEDAIRRLGIDQVHIGQLCESDPDRGSVVDDFQQQGSVWNACRELRADGKLGHLALDLCAARSQDGLTAVENDLFDAYVFTYNLLDRQANNALFDAMGKKKAKILALQTLHGEAEEPDHPDVQRRAALEPVFAESGCADWVEFGVRFLASQKQVLTTIGGAATLPHLENYLRAAQEPEPLPDAVLLKILDLHKEWCEG